MQAMTATLVRHQMNKDTFFSIITGIYFKWATYVAPVGGERCPVALFKFFVERRPLLQYAMVWFFLHDQ